MTNLHECPECHRMVKTLTRGVCHGRCYKKHIREGTRDSLPHTIQERVKRMDRIVEEYRQIAESHPDLSQREIAAKLGVPVSSLSAAAVSRGFRKPRRTGVGYVDYKSLVEDYQMLIESGESMDNIPARLGVSERTLWRAFKAVGR